MWSRSNPAGAERSARNVATSSPELASTTMQIATCTTVSAERRRPRRTASPAVVFSASASAARVACHAGAIPASRAAAAHSAHANANTRQLKRTSSATGTRLVARSRTCGITRATAGSASAISSSAPAPAACREQTAFGKPQPQQPRARGAQRGAQSHLAFSCSGARHHHAGDVGASQQQQQERTCEQGQQAGPETIAQAGDAALYRFHLDVLPLNTRLGVLGKRISAGTGGDQGRVHRNGGFNRGRRRGDARAKSSAEFPLPQQTAGPRSSPAGAWRRTAGEAAARIPPRCR